MPLCRAAYHLRNTSIARQSICWPSDRGQPTVGSWKREFSTAKINLAKKYKSLQKQAKPPQQRNPNAASRKPSAYTSHAIRLASIESPTLLYRAPSPMPYVLGCYFVGAGLFAMAGYNYSSQFSIPRDIGQDLPGYISTFNLISSLALAIAASYMCLRVRNDFL